jgi:hypothetical protein
VLEDNVLVGMEIEEELASRGDVASAVDLAEAESLMPGRNRPSPARLAPARLDRWSRAAPGAGRLHGGVDFGADSG